MTSPGINGRFSRQVILPGVGVEGQNKWENASVLLAGEGFALTAAQTALESVGVSRIVLLNQDSIETPSPFSVALVLTENEGWRRKLNRLLRHKPGKIVFGWPSGSGIALFSPEASGSCPCLECFEVMNPKAFSTGTAAVQRFLGATAASEILQLILGEKSPLAGMVWIITLDEGVSFRHKVTASVKCPAHLLEEGTTIIP